MMWWLLKCEIFRALLLFFVRLDPFRILNRNMETDSEETFPVVQQCYWEKLLMDNSALEIIFIFILFFIL